MRRFLLLSLTLLALGMLPKLHAQQPPSSIRELHTVQSGENLFRIALLYDLFAIDVARANGMAENATVAINQQLIIPYLYGKPDAPYNHAVQAGETIYSVATAYGLSISELLAQNGLSEGAALAVGDELVIVPGATTQSAKTAVDAGGDSASQAVDPSSLIIGGADFEYVHVVEAGDTVSELGSLFNLSVMALARTNNLRDPGVISVGQKLLIPGIEPPRLAYPLPDVVTDFALEPLVLQAGRTTRVKFLTGEAVEVSGTFLDMDLRIISAEAGTRHTILFGVPMETPKGVYPLRLALRGDEGRYAIEAQLQVIGGAYGYQSITLHDTSLLSPEIEAAERNWLTQTVAGFRPEKRWKGALQLPSQATINAWYGAWRSYNGSAYDRYHNGVDFAAPTGAPVLAAADGVVVAAEYLQIRGNTMVIDHGWGLFTVYAHLSEMAHKPGDRALGGQVLGGIGNTGRSTGPHLHWEVWLHGVDVDPMQWVNEVFP